MKGAEALTLGVVHLSPLHILLTRDRLTLNILAKAA